METRTDSMRVCVCERERDRSICQQAVHRPLSLWLLMTRASMACVWSMTAGHRQQRENILTHTHTHKLSDTINLLQRGSPQGADSCLSVQLVKKYLNAARLDENRNARTHSCTSHADKHSTCCPAGDWEPKIVEVTPTTSGENYFPICHSERVTQWQIKETH